MLARNSLLARLAASAATLASTKFRSASLPFLVVFDGLQSERQIGCQLAEQAEFLVVEGSGMVRVNGNERTNSRLPWIIGTAASER